MQSNANLGNEKSRKMPIILETLKDENNTTGIYTCHFHKVQSPRHILRYTHCLHIKWFNIKGVAKKHRFEILVLIHN